MNNRSWQTIADDQSILSAEGIGPEECDNEGNTLLHYAVASENLRLCIALSKWGWDPLQKNILGESPIDFANLRGFEDIASRLQEIALLRQINEKDEPAELKPEEPKPSDTILAEGNGFTSEIDPSEYHRQRNSQPLTGAFEPTSSTIDPDAVDWAPPAIDTDPDELGSATYSSAAQVASLTDVELIEERENSESKGSLFVVSRERLCILLETNKENLLRSLEDEGCQQQPVISSPSTVRLVSGHDFSKNSESQIEDSALLARISEQLEDKFVAGDILHPAAEPLLSDLKNGDLSAFSDRIVEILRGVQSDAMAHEMHSMEEFLTNKSGNGESNGEHRSNTRFFQHLPRISFVIQSMISPLIFPLLYLKKIFQNLLYFFFNLPPLILLLIFLFLSLLLIGFA